MMIILLHSHKLMIYFMKKLLLLFGVIAFNLTAHSQTSCATAVGITANGTYTTSTLTGTYKVVCYNSVAGIKGNWYKFTPTVNGEISISSNLPVNDGVTYSDDTRLSIVTGSCSGTMTCVSGNDDVDDENYLSEVLSLPVTAGTTYYIQWDSRWSTKPLQFTFDFVAVACARPTVFYLPEYVSTNIVDLYWDQTATIPSTYDVDWSYNFNAPAGTGTIISAPAGTQTYSTARIEGMTPSSNFRYFVRANCGSSQSSWSGPYYGYLPATLPYSNDFNDASKNYTDGFVNFSLFVASATSNPANYADGGPGGVMYTFNNTTTPSNSRAYFRGVNLQVGEVVTLSFKTRLYSAGTPAPMSFDLTVGNAQSASGQALVLQSYTNSSAASYTTHTATYTAASAGIHYFGIHNNSAAGAETFMFLDTITMQSNLSTHSFLSNNLSVFPNPADNVINISNALNAFIESIQLTDINGRIVKSESINASNNTQILINDLSAGVYLMTINTDQGNVVKKIVKN